MLDSALDALSPRKPLAVAAFVVVLLLTTVMFGFTATGHYAMLQQGTVSGTVTGYHVDESGSEPTVIVEVRVDNPTVRSIRVTNAGLTGYVNGDQVASSGGSYVNTVVESGDSKVVTVRLRPDNGQATRMIAATKSGQLRVTGSIRAKVEAAEFNFDVYNDSRGGSDA